METRQTIYKYIGRATKQYLADGQWIASTAEIADELHLSRSLVSKHLNTLYEKGLLIRIVGRPVWYLDKKALEEECGERLEASEFLSREDFEKSVRLKKQERASLERIVGYKASLSDGLLKLGTLARYPSERPVVVSLYGEKGTGKRFLADALFEQGKQYGRILTGKKMQVWEWGGLEQHEKILFHKTEGPLARSSGTLLLIEGAEMIPEKTQKRLASWLKSEAAREERMQYLVLSSIQNPKDIFCDSLYELISAKLFLPPLLERSQKEREELVYVQLLKESKRIKKSLRISNLAFSALSNGSYDRNIDGLIQAVRETCSHAYVESAPEEDRLIIHQYHLPDEVLGVLEEEEYSEALLWSLEDICRQLQDDRMLGCCEAIRRNFALYQNGEVNEETFIHLCGQNLNQYGDYLVYEKKTNNARIEGIERVLKNIFDIIGSKHKVTLNMNYAFVLARILYKCTYVDNDLQGWEKQNASFVCELQKFLQEVYENEYAVAREVEGLIQNSLEILPTCIGLFFLVLNIHINNFALPEFKVTGLIAAHGYSTASSIADAVNRLLGQGVFEAVDMPLEVGTEEIVAYIKRHMKRRRVLRELILMVDMGSLEEIGYEISRSLNIRVGVINNVSTRAALGIGSRIVEEYGLAEILEQACKENVCSYRIIENEIRQDAIIFASDVSIHAADRLIQVFKNSFPKPVEIRLIACDGVDLANQRRNDFVFSNYNILFITGTLKSVPEGMTYIPLEDVVSLGKVEQISRFFEKYFDREEMRRFNANLLKNFSLENVMESLTILNPGPLMDFIERALNELQRELKTQFGSRIMVGLYLHISCLTERLVTKSPAVMHENLEDFKREKKDFIDSLEQSFKELGNHYNITIPVSEMAYLYDYIYNGFYKNGGKEGDGCAE